MPGNAEPTPQIRVLRLLITDYGEADLELTEYAPITQLAAGGYQHAKKEFSRSGVFYELPGVRQQLCDLVSEGDRVLRIVPVFPRSGVPFRRSRRSAAVDVADVTSLHGRGAAGLLRSL